MKMRVKLFAVLLAVALLLTACSGGKTAVNSAAPASTSGAPAGTAAPADTTASGSSTDKPYAGYNIVLFSFAGWVDQDLQEACSAKLKEATGMTVSFIIVPWANRFTQMATMVSAGQQIDVTGKSTPGDMSILCDAGSLLPLDDYYKNSTVFSADNWTGGQYMDMMKYAGDGKTYGIPVNPPQGYIWTINKAWLDKLNLQTPTTLDELNTVLQKFKDAKLGGDATICIAHQFPNEDHIATFLGMWGLKGPWLMKDDNGSIYHPWLTQNGQAGLQWMQDMYKQGILDPNFATENGTTIYDKVKAGDVGIFLDWAGNNKAYNEAAKTSGALCNMVAMQIPQALSNVAPVNCGNTIIMDNIVSTSKNPDAAWAFIEWLNTADGIRNWTWTKDVNYSVNTDGSINVKVTQLHSGGYNSTTFTKAMAAAPDVYKLPQESIDGNAIFFKNWAFPPVLKDAGDANDIALPLATRVITNQLSVADFVSQLTTELTSKGYISKAAN
jgi:putative aldouronate transport system substrate-binding protein